MNIVFFNKHWVRVLGGEGGVGTRWGVCMLIKIEKERSDGRCCLGHLLDLWCRDLVWLQLNPEGGFPVDLWSLSRRCRSDLYLPLPPRGNGDDFHDNGSDSHSISGRLSLLSLTMPRLYWRLQPWTLGPRQRRSPSANLLFLTDMKTYVAICPSAVHLPGHIWNSTRSKTFSFQSWFAFFFANWGK